MAKTNFSKVEGALNEGLLKLTVKNLLDLADVASGKNVQNPAKIAEARKTLANVLKLELKHLAKQDAEIYTKLQLDKDALAKLMEHSDNLTNAEWDQLLNAKVKVDQFRQEQQKALTPEVNEKLVEEERHKHINKRFNINDKWLPLR